MKTRTSILCILLVAAANLVGGCRGIYSEIQKKKILVAGPTAIVQGTELRLESALKRSLHSDSRNYDLKGKLTITAINGSFPPGVDVFHLALKPGWKGWPGYYVLNFVEQDGCWRMVGDSRSRAALRFHGFSIREAGQLTILFTWEDLGGFLGGKPEHFASYDVSVTVSDSRRKRYILTNAGVPTD